MTDNEFLATELFGLRFQPAEGSNAGPIYGKLPAIPEGWVDDNGKYRSINFDSTWQDAGEVIEAMEKRKYEASLCVRSVNGIPDYRCSFYATGNVSTFGQSDNSLPQAIAKAARAALEGEK